MKKKIFNLLLLVCVFGLAIACYLSIYSEISFTEELKSREACVQSRLLQIREAELAYKTAKRDYCGDLDSLIDWVKNGQAVKSVLKEGELTDDQLESGMTEAEAIQQGILVRDTTWIPANDTLHIKNPDSLKYIPVGNTGGKIQLRKNSLYNMRSQQEETVVEFRASLDDYSQGMSEKKIKSLKADLKKRGKNLADLQDFESDVEDWYGLRMGDLLDSQNKMAGNWE